MIQWFKDGKALPKRYVWEIVLGAHDHFVKEKSMVKVDVPEGVTCDVIGDVHGACFPSFNLEYSVEYLYNVFRAILRYVTPVFVNW